MPTLTQEKRLLKIATSLGEDALILQSLSGEEGICSLFRFRLLVQGADAAIAANTMLGSTITCTIAPQNAAPRHIHGYVVRWGPGDSGGRDLTSYRCEIAPWLWFLSHTTDCRVFQAKNAKQILEELFGDAGFDAFDFTLGADPPTREYVIQYNETDFAFACRLMEEEGLFWYFTHAEDGHRLVVTDSNDGFLGDAPRKLTAGKVFAGSDTYTDHVLQADWVPGKVATSTYEFRSSQTDMLAEKNSVLERPMADKFEQFHWPGRYPNVSRGDSPAAPADGEPIATRMVEAIEASAERVQFSSGANWLAAGQVFTLGPYVEEGDADKDYVITSVSHTATDETHLNNRAQPSYGNSAVAAPSDVPYRPAMVAAMPKLPPLMSATVVGPDGEEIEVDEFGRVKIQFHWDRLGEGNENSSCFVRLAQPWAGNGWGMMLFPRIGTEVVVGFLDGDPDHPVVIGALHNGQMPLFATQPDNKTQSGIMTRSTPDGGTSDYNALIFEDKAGNEKVIFQAQKDYERLVKNNETVTVKMDRSVTIEGKQTHVTKGDYTFTVQEGNQKVEITQGNFDTKVATGNMSVKVSTGNLSTKVDLGKIDTEAMQSIELKVGSNSIKIDQMGVTIKGTMIKIEGTAMLDAKAPMAKLSGDAMVMLKGGIIMIN
jgi:type VI secretion system secreted protein VgrG